jgi:ubiquinone/menaquinone biosynthesis C-methylase UbiE
MTTTMKARNAAHSSPVSGRQSRAPSLSAFPSDFYDRVKPRLHQRIRRELQSARAVLDVGCGDCELVRLLNERRGQDAIGVDISDASFPDPAGFRKSTGEPREARCVKADATALGFLADSSVDAAVCMWALHEFRDAPASLREIRRVLRTDGELVLVEFPQESLARKLWNESYWTPAEIRALVRQNGFDSVHVKLIERRQIMWATAFKQQAAS